MDEETKQLLEDTYSLTKENNKLLHKVRGVQKRAELFYIIKILFFIGLSVGAFYYVQPYLEKVFNLYSSITNTTQELNNQTNSLKDIFKKPR